jgi:hypothetical protein
MNRIPYKIRAAVDGAASGLVLALVLSVAITATAFFTNTPLGIPGVFSTYVGSPTDVASGTGAITVQFALGWNGFVAAAVVGMIARLLWAHRYRENLPELTG